MIFFQLLFNSIVSGLLLAMVAMGFNMIFNTTKVFHLAHGAVYTGGAFLLVLFLNLFDVHTFLVWFVAFLCAFLVVAGALILIELGIYWPLSRRRSGQAITLISSLGLYILLVNLIALCFGNEMKFIDPGLGQSMTFFGVIIMPIQLVQLGVSMVMIISLLLASRSVWFLQVRSLMSNETAALVLGVDASRVRIVILLVGSLLAMLAGILRLYDTGIDPQSGMAVTLSGVVAVIVGGRGSLVGTTVAALLIAFLQCLVEWSLSAQWRDGITFLLLLVVILYRTEGVVSYKMRLEEK